VAASFWENFVCRCNMFDVNNNNNNNNNIYLTAVGLSPGGSGF
jgi:hypothetical protein